MTSYIPINLTLQKTFYSFTSLDHKQEKELTLPHYMNKGSRWLYDLSKTKEPNSDKTRTRIHLCCPLSALFKKSELIYKQECHLKPPYKLTYLPKIWLFMTFNKILKKTQILPEKTISV